MEKGKRMMTMMWSKYEKASWEEKCIQDKGNGMGKKAWENISLRLGNHNFYIVLKHIAVLE